MQCRQTALVRLGILVGERDWAKRKKRVVIAGRKGDGGRKGVFRGNKW